MLPASAAPAERFSQCFPHRQPQRSGKLFRTDFRFDPSLRSAPASNKPHPAEKSTPVWLAIWRTWAGFANSQLRCATFISLYLYVCAYPRYCHLGAAAQTDANLSAHLHRLPTPPPYLRQMRLLPGRGAGVGCKMRLSLCQGEGVGWQMMLLVVRVAVPADQSK